MFIDPRLKRLASSFRSGTVCRFHFAPKRSFLPSFSTKFYKHSAPTERRAISSTDGIVIAYAAIRGLLNKSSENCISDSAN